MSDGQTSGTVGLSKRIEAIKITLVNMPGYSVEYQTHVANIGWQSWVADGQIAGITGLSIVFGQGFDTPHLHQISTQILKQLKPL